MKNIAININSTSTTATKGKPGRPAVPVTFPVKGSFTLKDVQALNPNVKSVTIRSNVLRAVDNGTLTKLVKTVKSGKKGKPAFKFMLTEALNRLKAKDTQKAVVTV